MSESELANEPVMYVSKGAICQVLGISKDSFHLWLFPRFPMSKYQFGTSTRAERWKASDVAERMFSIIEAAARSGLSLGCEPERSSRKKPERSSRKTVEARHRKGPGIGASPTQGTCFVYVIANASSSYFKVGVSKDVDRRMRDLQSANPEKLRVLGKVQLDSREAAMGLESRIHRSLAVFGASGEWFEMSERSLSAVARFGVANGEGAK